MKARAGLLTAVVLLLGQVERASEGAEPSLTFADVAHRVHLGRVMSFPGLGVALLRIDPKSQPDLATGATLRDAKPSVLDLPLPAGEFYVRVGHRGSLPLQIPVGETLLTPLGPSRTVDRDVWLPPDSAAFLPVVHGTPLLPFGPYVSRGRGLTPFEIERLTSGEWAARVRARNAHFGVPLERRDDASAAYVEASFDTQTVHARELIPTPDGGRDVGFVVSDRRGPLFVRIETDARRLAASWSRWRDAIALDATFEVAQGRTTNPVNEAELRTQLGPLLSAIVTAPMQSRPTYGMGSEHRWALSDGTGAWTGLAIDGRPATLTLLRNPPNPTPGTPQPPNPPEDTDPARDLVERKARPTEAEERYGDRRDPDHAGGIGGVGGVR